MEGENIQVPPRLSDVRVFDDIVEIDCKDSNSDIMIMKPDKENKLVVKEKVKDTSIEKQEKSSILDKKTENKIINNDAKENIQKLARKRNDEDIPKAVFENRTNESPEQPFKALRGDETSSEEIICTKNLEPKAGKDLGPVRCSELDDSTMNSVPDLEAPKYLDENEELGKRRYFFWERKPKRQRIPDDDFSGMERNSKMKRAMAVWITEDKDRDDHECFLIN
ncbi:hypothetical protein HI914_07242 [Erysiphe necator]|nr:hypothetical protein HI914_07242 [Erysiphe necator]